VVALSLTLNGWWQANDDSVVESCSSSAGPGSCYVFCGSSTTITATVTDDDYSFDDVHFPPQINTYPHYSETSYCVATLDGSCARKYWLIFRLVPIALHLCQFLMQCVAWWLYGNANPQQRQYDVLIAFVYPELLEHFCPQKEITVVSTSGRAISVTQSSTREGQVTLPGHTSSVIAMLRLLSQPRLFSLFAVVEVLCVVYVWGELLYPATYCGDTRPLSLYYYPMLLTLLDLMKFNTYVANQLANSNSGKHKAICACLNMEMFISNMFLCVSLTCLFFCGLFYDVYRSVHNAILHCRGEDVPRWPHESESDQSDVTNSITTNPIFSGKTTGIVDEEALSSSRDLSVDDPDGDGGIRLSQHVTKNII
jgi:hypothetical protein